MRIDLPDPEQFAELVQIVTGDEITVLPTGISTDSRECQSGDLYVAIKGERVDGHDFLEQVKSAGASAALVERVNPAITGLKQIQVNNPVRTLGLIASDWRRQFTIPVIGITGTNGKTSTKELLAHLLSAKYKVHVTTGNFNTSIGLPLTLLQMTSEHEISVLEFGANQPGDIVQLTNMAKPTHGLITNIAPAHLEGFGSIEEIARTKSELFWALPQGTAFVNLDDKRVSRIDISGDQISFSFHSPADFTAQFIGKAGVNSLLMTINGQELSLPTCNPVFAKNLLAASAIAITLELDWSALQKQLLTFQSPKGRCVVIESGGLTIIDDTYNANLVSTAAAIDFLANFQTTGRKILIFGDMFELGPDSPKLHRQVGDKANETRLDAVFTVGNDSRYTYDTIENNTKKHFTDKTQLLVNLSEYFQTGDTILLKGSRGMAMETLIDELRAT